MNPRRPIQAMRLRREAREVLKTHEIDTNKNRLDLSAPERLKQLKSDIVSLSGYTEGSEGVITKGTFSQDLLIDNRYLINIELTTITIYDKLKYITTSWYDPTNEELIFKKQATTITDDSGELILDTEDISDLEETVHEITLILDSQPEQRPGI